MDNINKNNSIIISFLNATLCDVATLCDAKTQSSLRGRFLEILCSNPSHCVATSHSVASMKEYKFVSILHI